MHNVLIWGTAKEYDNYLTLIKYYEDKKLFRVIGVTSNDTYYSYLDGYQFIPKKDLMNVEYDWIIICASKEKTRDIRKEAIAMNISEDILFPAHILLVPNFDFDKYIKLSQSKISIFANNCWGGQVYRRLGLKVRSPFYNMFESVNEYAQFLKNAKDILLNERLQFQQMQYNDELSVDYPVYELAGMQLHMYYYPDKEEAERKWYERVDRINWDNLFVMMYTDSLKLIEEFSTLPYQRKICFTSKKIDMPYTYCLPLDKVRPDNGFGGIVIGSATGRFKLYDVMDLLLYGHSGNDNRIKWRN